MNEIYTPEEVADRWRTSTDTVYRMLASGKLKGFKVGKGWRISAAAVAAVENGAL